MGTLLVHITCGPESPTKAALGLLVAKAAIDEGHQVEVFLAGDRPYGLMQAAVTRPGEPDQPAAWEWLGGFC